MVKRGYCNECGRRTSHKNKQGEWICTFCETSLIKKMGLEDELENISENDEAILEVVNKAGLNSRELKLLLNQPKPSKSIKTYDHKSNGHVKIGILSDTHIGHKEFDEGLFKYAGEVFRAEGIKNVYHAGDLLEGMSGRPGHVFELSQIGFSQQINYAQELFEKYMKSLTVYGITGNHDHWYKKGNNGGVNVGEEFSNRVKNYIFLGEDEADIRLAPKVVMKLFHPGDGTAYATSYKLQKLMESFEGGHKPNILIEGHYHKALYMFNRNIHGIEAGTICGQTGWMRGKKIPAHKGFWILDISHNKKGINSIKPTFFPAYD